MSTNLSAGTSTGTSADVSAVTWPSRPTPAAPTPWTFPPIDEALLTNGLRVVGCPLPGRALASARLVLRTPISTEAPGQEGALTVLAMALTEGTAQTRSDAFTDALESLGATVNAALTSRGLTLLLDAPASRMPAALALLAEAVQAPDLSADTVDRVRSRRRDALTKELALGPQLAERAARSGFYRPDSRLALDTYGTLESLDALDAAAIAHYTAAALRPGTATLVLAGDLGTGLADLAATALGGWVDTAAADPSAGVALREDRVVELADRPGAVQTDVVLVGEAPTNHDPSWAAEDLAAHILGGSMGSRLMASLREEKGYTYGISASVVSEGDHAVRRIRSSVEAGVTIAALTEITAVLEAFVAGGVTADELASAKSSRLGGVPLTMQTAGDLASTVADAVADGLPIHWLAGRSARTAACTADDVNEAASHWAPAAMRLAAAGSAEHLTADLSSLSFGAVNAWRPR